MFSLTNVQQVIFKFLLGSKISNIKHHCRKNSIILISHVPWSGFHVRKQFLKFRIQNVLNAFENNVLSLEVLLYGRLKIDFKNQSQIA